MIIFEAGPELDAKVALALGLDVLGMAVAIHFASWHIPFDGVGKVTRPVYLTDCVCEHRADYDADILGHIAGCLEVVPCYSTSDDAAMAAVDEMLDTGRFTGFELLWRPGLGWSALFLGGDYCPDGDGATRALAICRAIVAMGEGK